MSNSRPRVHKDLDNSLYPGVGESALPPLWDMRYDPRSRDPCTGYVRFPYRFPYYGPQTSAFMPRVDRLCVLFRYHPKVDNCWTFDIVHRGSPSSTDGFAVTAEDVLAGIYEHLQRLPSEEDRRNSPQHNMIAEKARVERCQLLGLDKRKEPVRRIDYMKGVLGHCAFAGLSGYNRHLATTTLRIYLVDVETQ